MQLLIKDIWIQKALLDGSPMIRGQNTSLEEFLYLYLRKRFGEQEVIVEWGYNINAGAKHHLLQSVDCRVFHDVLAGILSEDVFKHIVATVDEVKRAFYNLDKTQTSKHAQPKIEVLSPLTVAIPKAGAVETLRRQFPYKKPSRMEELEMVCGLLFELTSLQALAVDAIDGKMLNFHVLFNSEDDGSFVDTLKTQIMDEIDEYWKSLQVA